MLLSRGSSHRTGTDAEMIRWAAPFARVDGRRDGAGGRGRGGRDAGARRPVGRPEADPRQRRAAARQRAGRRPSDGGLRARGDASRRRCPRPAPGGPRRAGVPALPGLRRRPLRVRACADPAQPPAPGDPRGAGVPRPARVLGREAAGVRGGRPGGPPPPAGRAGRPPRLGPCGDRPGRGPAGAVVRHERPGRATARRPARALARRLRETAEKELWNGTTLVGPHRDDLAFALDGRELSSFASRGQQRTAILALKLAELDLLAALDGAPPLLLLDDVFSELDPARRAHLVRRIAALPQAFVTTTTLDDLDPGLRAAGTAWRVDGAPPGPGAAGPGARLVEASA